jgi:hypothetical protein
MTYVASKIAIWLLIAFIAGLIVGWRTSVPRPKGGER